MRSALATLAACGLLVACGDAPTPIRTAATTPTPTPSSTAPLQFVGSPVVIDTGPRGGTRVWVRLNRPLRYSEGRPGDSRGFDAYIKVPGTNRDYPGVYRDPAFPTCYGQHLYGHAAGTVTVTLVLSKRKRLTATAQPQPADTTSDVDPPVREQLACPPSPDAAHQHQCHGTVSARYAGFIGIDETAFASCRTARRVMRSVGRWASARCYRTLCAAAHRMNLGYRCDADLTGEAYWSIWCQRGRSIVRGSTSE